MAALRAGLLRVVPQPVLDLLTWQQLERKVCGNPELTVDDVKKFSKCQGWREALLDNARPSHASCAVLSSRGERLPCSLGPPPAFTRGCTEGCVASRVNFLCWELLTKHLFLAAVTFEDLQSDDPRIRIFFEALSNFTSGERPRAFPAPHPPGQDPRGCPIPSERPAWALGVTPNLSPVLPQRTSAASSSSSRAAAASRFRSPSTQTNRGESVRPARPCPRGASA